MTQIRVVVVACYIAAIVAANILTANEPPLMFDWLGQTWVITWGTFFIAATFWLRDAVQMATNKLFAYGAIAVALALNVGLSLHYDDLLWVTVGSALAFAVSESFDTEVFSRWRGNVGSRVAVSGVAGGTLDSVVFALVGLSPWTSNLVPWEFLWTVIVANIVIKAAASLVVGATLASAEEEYAEA